MKKLLSFAMTAALILGLVSCSNEIENEIDGANGNAAVQFSFKTNKGNLVTRAIANDDEMALSNVDIYAFSGGNRLGDGKLALGTDIKVTTGTGTINYAATAEWLVKHVGKTVNFYFVANDATSTGGAHISTIPASEAEFVELVTKDVPKTADLYNAIAPDLLFSQSVKGIVLNGKIQKDVTLARRVARFDIVNELYEDFTVNNIKIDNANVNGYIFGDATGQATINKGRHAELPGLTSSDYDTTDPDEPIAESVFYLYPTTIGTAENGETEILINATIGGETDNYLVKTNTEIKANHRYKLILDPLELEFYIVAGDWEDDAELETGFGKDTKITLSDVSADNRLNPANNVFQFNYPDPTKTTFSFKATTVYGTRARINYIEGVENDLSTKLEVKRASTTAYTRAAFETVDTYTITLPEADAGKFNIQVEIYAPGNPSVKEVYYFKRDIWNGALRTEPGTSTHTYNGKTYDVFEIDEASKLVWLSDKVNAKDAAVQGKSVLLTGEIDFGNEPCDPIGYQNFGTDDNNLKVNENKFTANPLFTGSIFGGDHTISNVKLTSRNSTGRGLFAHVIGTGSSNPVIVDGVNIDGILVGGGGKWSGGLIGYVRDVAQISNCSVNRIAIGTGSDNGWSYACGALVGFISSTNEITISNCSTSYIEYGPIGWNNSGFIGKLVNNGKVTIEDCSPSKGYCHTYLPVGETNDMYSQAPYNQYFLGAEGFNNSWFIGHISWKNGMQLIINNVKDNSANWKEWTKNKGAGTDITADEQAAAVAWPYITAFDGYTNMTSGSIMIDGEALVIQ